MIGTGVVVALLGLLFTFQGVGTIEGSAMSNSNFWALAGPVIAAAGVILVIRGIRRGRPSALP